MPTPTSATVDTGPWTVAQGFAGSWTITLRDQTGAIYTGYAGSEGLSGVVWAGEDTPALLTFTTTWLDASAGTIAVALSQSQTATLDIGRYKVRVFLTDKSADLYEGSLEITYSPGSQPAMTAYCGFQDLLDRAPWLEKLQKSSTDTTGFLRQRSQARKWFEDLLHRHYRAGSGISTDFAFVPGLSFGGWYGQTFLWRDGRRSSDLQGWLDANKLDVTAQVTEANACYAIALICDRQVVPGKDDNGYGAMGRKFFARADDVALNITAELDTNGDGKNDTAIRLGIVDTMEG